MNPKIALALLALLAAFGCGWWLRDAQAQMQQSRAATEAALRTRDATLAARMEEQEQQGKINAILAEQNRRAQSVAANLARELDGMRQRAERAERSVSNAARAACAGADGRELSRPDAEFLARLAARADEQRAALSACYAVLDGLQSDRKK